jgi:hypothetical protein
MRLSRHSGRRAVLRQGGYDGAQSSNSGGNRQAGFSTARRRRRDDPGRHFTPVGRTGVQRAGPSSATSLKRRTLRPSGGPLRFLRQQTPVPALMRGENIKAARKPCRAERFARLPRRPQCTGASSMHGSRSRIECVLRSVQRTSPTESGAALAGGSAVTRAPSLGVGCHPIRSEAGESADRIGIFTGLPRNESIVDVNRRGDSL